MSATGRKTADMGSKSGIINVYIRRRDIHPLTCCPARGILKIRKNRTYRDALDRTRWAFSSVCVGRAKGLGIFLTNKDKGYETTCYCSV